METSFFFVVLLNLMAFYESIKLLTLETWKLLTNLFYVFRPALIGLVAGAKRHRSIVYLGGSPTFFHRNDSNEE